MKLQFFLVLAIYSTIGIVSARKSGGGYREAILSCDSYIDSLIESIMSNNGEYFDPHSINDTILTFQKKVIFVDIKGEAKLSEGFISGLSNIRRVSSCFMSFEDSRLKLTAKLQTDRLFFNFTGSVKVMNMGPAIFVSGNCSNVNIIMTFTMNSTTGKEALLEQFKIIDIEDVKVTVYGLRLLSWVNEPMGKSALDFFKASTKKLVEMDMGQLIEERMIAKPFSLADFEIDVKDIVDDITTLSPTTTTDDSIEGKLVYTKEDSNSYIDSILENRYMLESQYSKLDPYALEDDKITDAFVTSTGKENYIELTNGHLYDLHKIRRIQDCTQPVLRASNITFICYLGFDKLEMKYSAKAYNHDTVSDFEMIALVLNTRLSAKITTNIKDNVPNLLSLGLNHLGKMTIKAAQVIAEAPLSFAQSSYDQTAIITHFSELLKKILLGRLKAVLSYSIYKTPVHFLD